MKSNLNKQKEKHYICYQLYDSWVTKPSLFFFQLKLQFSSLSGFCGLFLFLFSVSSGCGIFYLYLGCLLWPSFLNNLSIGRLHIFLSETLFYLVDSIPNFSIFCNTSHFFEMQITIFNITNEPFHFPFLLLFNYPWFYMLI